MFISIDKRSKKDRKEYYNEKRKDWGSIKPYTRVHSPKNLTNVISVSSWKRNCNHTFNFVENLIDGVYYFKIVCSKCGYTNIYSIKQEDYLKWKENNS